MTTLRSWLVVICIRIAVWHYQQSRRWYGYSARIEGVGEEAV